LAFSTLSFVLRPGMGNENLGPRRPMIICELAAAIGTRRLPGGSTLRQTATQRVQDGWAVGLIQAPSWGQRLSKRPMWAQLRQEAAAANAGRGTGARAIYLAVCGHVRAARFGLWSV